MRYQWSYIFLALTHPYDKQGSLYHTEDWWPYMQQWQGQGQKWFTQWFGTHSVNLLRLRQNGHLFAYDTLKRIFLNENIIISTKNSLKFVPKGLINNMPALVLIMAWCRPGDKPLSEPMLVRSMTHICVTRPQWVKCITWTMFAYHKS